MAGVMTRLLPVRGNKSAMEAQVMFDTGASHSFVSKALARKLGTIAKLPEPMRFILGDGSEMVIDECMALAIEVAGQWVLDTFLVQEQAAEEVLLGASTMRKYGLKIDMEHAEIFLEIKEQAVFPLQTITPLEVHTMDEKLTTVLTRLGIEATEGMTDEQAIEKIVAAAKPKPTSLKPVLPASPKILGALKLTESATEDQIHGAILALQNRNDIVSAAEYNQIKAEMHARDTRDALLAAVHAGKITPAEQPSWEDKLNKGEITLATFQAFVDARPQVVPINRELPKGPQQQEGAKQAVTVVVDVNGIYAERRKARAA